MKTPEVLVIGRNCIDHISVVEDFPREDQKRPLIHRLVEGGGQGGTSSCCIAKLGGHVIHVGRLGTDREGNFCKERLIAFGVNTDFVQKIDGGTTPVAYIFITRSNGRRTIVYEPNRLPKLEIGDIVPPLRACPKTILLDPETTYLFGSLKQNLSGNSKIVYDCERWRKGIEGIMAQVDYFIPSHEFLESEELNAGGRSFADKMTQLKSMVKGELIVTRGEKGAYYFVGKHLYRVHPPAILVKDTLGAGDNFHGAFALAVSRGLDIHESVKFSVSVASLSCRAYGGRNAIPGIEEAGKTAANLQCTLVNTRD